MLSVKAMAMTVLDLLEQPALVTQAQAAFHQGRER
jgi:hypothetical protein